MTRAHDIGLVEGFLLAHNAPVEIRHAMERISWSALNEAGEALAHSSPEEVKRWLLHNPPATWTSTFAHHGEKEGHIDAAPDTRAIAAGLGISHDHLTDDLAAASYPHVSALVEPQKSVPADEQESAAPPPGDEPPPTTRKPHAKTVELVDKLRSYNGQLTQAQMAERAKNTVQRVWYLCKEYDIPFKQVSSRGTGWSSGRGKIARETQRKAREARAVEQQAQAEALAAESTTYVDEQGRTITKCPPRWANGVGMGRITVGSSASRGTRSD